MENTFVADEILRQIGGNRFIAMTGSKNFLADGNSLRMTLAKNTSKANRLKITLEADDTYTMTFTRYTAPRLNRKTWEYSDENIKEIETVEGVYCDGLEKVFTRVTGLYTRF